MDDALVGTYTFASISEGFSFGNDAIGLGLDFSGSYTELPGDDFIDFDTFSIQSFNPEDLDVSTVVLLSLKEQSGSGSTSPVEIGPNTANTVADLVYYDNLEIPTSLPNATIRCVKFTSLIPGEDALIPDTISLLSSGILRLDRFTPVIGGTTGRFIYGLHGQALGQFGGSSNMKYKVTGLFD